MLKALDDELQHEDWRCLLSGVKSDSKLQNEPGKFPLHQIRNLSSNRYVL